MFTQPLMYKKIRQHKNAHQQYVERLLAEGSISKQQVKSAVGGWVGGWAFKFDYMSRGQPCIRGSVVPKTACLPELQLFVRTPCWWDVLGLCG